MFYLNFNNFHTRFYDIPSPYHSCLSIISTLFRDVELVSLKSFQHTFMYTVPATNSLNNADVPFNSQHKTKSDNFK